MWASVKVDRNRNHQLPIAKVLNERIENPAFKSVSPSRRVVNDKVLIANERNNRNKDSRRNKESSRNNESRHNLRKDVRIKGSPREVNTLDIRQQLPVLSYLSNSLLVVEFLL